MSKLSETDKLANILSNMMEKNELDRLRDEEKRIERARRDEEKQERWEEEQLRRKERRAKETRDMIEALREAQPAVPQTVFIENTKLPKMSDGEDI